MDKDYLVLHLEDKTDDHYSNGCRCSTRSSGNFLSEISLWRLLFGANRRWKNNVLLSKKQIVYSISKEKTGWFPLLPLPLLLESSYFTNGISKRGDRDVKPQTLEILKILSMFMTLTFLSPICFIILLWPRFDMRTINHLLSKGRSQGQASFSIKSLPA